MHIVETLEIEQAPKNFALNHQISRDASPKVRTPVVKKESVQESFLRRRALFFTSKTDKCEHQLMERITRQIDVLRHVQ